MNIKNALIEFAMTMVVMMVLGLLFFIFSSGLFSSWYYDLIFFTMGISEWDGSFRVILYLYVVFSFCLSVKESIKKLRVKK